MLVHFYTSSGFLTEQLLSTALKPGFNIVLGGICYRVVRIEYKSKHDCSAYIEEVTK